jgi:hypothetical protein
MDRRVSMRMINSMTVTALIRARYPYLRRKSGMGLHQTNGSFKNL